MQTDIAIVGGGLSGLALADHLHRAGREFLLIEARDRLGGRIKAHHGVDLGPSWFWPGQPRMAALARRLSLDVFTQYATGDLSFETANGQVQRGVGFSSMEGSYRIDGGMQSLVDALAATLPPELIFMGNGLSRIERSGDVILTLADARQITAQKVVLALPPRVAAGIGFDPALTDLQMAALRDVPTWMGGQAKIVATYKAPFWRYANLSGDAMSRHGPLHEIHDASSKSGAPAALFGFVGVPPAHRAGNKDQLLMTAKDQLVRLFGSEAGAPDSLVLQDWAFEPETASPLDHAPLTHHPDYRLPDALAHLWGGTLMLGSTEVAPEFGGYLEGALSAAEHLAARLAAG